MNSVTMPSRPPASFTNFAISSREIDEAGAGGLNHHQRGRNGVGADVR